MALLGPAAEGFGIICSDRIINLFKLVPIGVQVIRVSVGLLENDDITEVLSNEVINFSLTW